MRLNVNPTKMKKMLPLFFLILVGPAVLVILMDGFIHQRLMANYVATQEFQILEHLNKGVTIQDAADLIALSKDNRINWYSYDDERLFWPNQVQVEDHPLDPNNKDDIIYALKKNRDSSSFWLRGRFYYLLYPIEFKGQKQLILSVLPKHSLALLNFSIICFWMVILLTAALIYRWWKEKLFNRQKQTIKTLIDKEKLALKASNYQQNILIESIPMGIVLIDEQDHVKLFNPTAKQLLGLQVNDQGQSYSSVFKSHLLVSLIDYVKNNHKSLQEEVEVWLPTHRRLDVHVIFYNKSYTQNQLLVLLYDLTPLKYLENVRTEFVANASHELRTPVTAILGFAELLSGQGNWNPEQVREFSSIILKESKRLEKITHEILTLAKIENKQMQMKMESFDLVAWLTEHFASYQDSLSNKNMSIKLESPQQLWITSDVDKIHHIMSNLITNAINYSYTSGKITVKVKSFQDKVEIKVMDQGVGIDKKDQDRIFERFYRVDKSRSRQVDGTGLGLSIVRHLVDSLKGRIKVDSQLGKGSTFSVYLPKTYDKTLHS